MACGRLRAMDADGFAYTSTGTSSASEDLIHQVIRKEVETYRIKSFQNFSKDLYVYPATTAREVYAEEGEFLGWNSYIFQARGLEKHMRVRLSSNGRRVKAKTRVQTGWRSISWIMEKLDPERDFSELHSDAATAQRIRLQSSWWNQNNKVFRFLELPSEIRNTIYGFACGGPIEPYPSMWCRRLIKGGPAHQDMVARQPNMGLFRVNKQVFTEAQHYLYSNTPFLVEHKEVLSRLMQSHVFSVLRKLTLSLTLDGYFRVFGYSFGTNEEAHTRPPSRAAEHFRQMRLSSLTINVPPPSQLHNLAWLDDVCHVIIVDCLFEAMWDFIRGHPVRFTGFIKDHQLHRYTALCGAEHKLAMKVLQSTAHANLNQKCNLVKYHEYLWLSNEDEEEGGVRLDGEPIIKLERTKFNEMQSIKSMPIECKCSPPCFLETWDPKM